ncbi:MAG: hypothetical protein J5658_04055 [Prevotella sp.]|nr:hypothetical protein [Prevotella sp.]
MKRGKKPTLEDFTAVAEATKGTISKMAEAFGVDRCTVYNWCAKDPRFNAVVENYKGKFLDECLRSGRVLALGIPKDANDLKKGWVSPPDGSMLRYFISTLGRKEGYGEAIDITSKGESIKPDPVIVEVIDNRDKVEKAQEEEQQ